MDRNWVSVFSWVLMFGTSVPKKRLLLISVGKSGAFLLGIGEAESFSGIWSDVFFCPLYMHCWNGVLEG